MLIGVISDTHIPNRAKILPDKIFEVFKDVDLILHAGDIEEYCVLDELETIAPVTAVRGNCDKYLGLKRKEIIEVEGTRIGLTHGVVYPKGDTQKLYYLARQFDVDILITGHTHRPLIQKIDDILFLNPGSPTKPRLSEPSVMLLEITDKQIKAEIVILGQSTCKALDFSQFEQKKE